MKMITLIIGGSVVSQKAGKEVTIIIYSPVIRHLYAYIKKQHCLTRDRVRCA